VSLRKRGATSDLVIMSTNLAEEAVNAGYQLLYGRALGALVPLLAWCTDGHLPSGARVLRFRRRVDAEQVLRLIDGQE